MLPELPKFPSQKEKRLEDEYRRMAADANHEREANEWCEGLIGDVADTD
jgi:hypothetical protein